MNSREVIRKDKTDLVLGRAIKLWVEHSALPESSRENLIRAARSSPNIQPRRIFVSALARIANVIRKAGSIPRTQSYGLQANTVTASDPQYGSMSPFPSEAVESLVTRAARKSNSCYKLESTIIRFLHRMLEDFNNFLIIEVPEQPRVLRHGYYDTQPSSSLVSMSLSDHAAAYSLYTGYRLAATI